MVDTDESAKYTCDLCNNGILPEEPYAALTLAQVIKSVEGQSVTLEMPLDCGILEVCRDCSERLQLTAMSVSSSIKFQRLFTRLTTRQPALQSFSRQFQFDELPEGVDTTGIDTCDFCGHIREPREVWVELTVGYQKHVIDKDHPQGSIEVLDAFDSIVMCPQCCDTISLPTLSKDSKWRVAEQWTAALLALFPTTPRARREARGEICPKYYGRTVSSAD